MLEHQFGQEGQDEMKEAIANLRKCQRGRGQSFRAHINNFECYLSEAEAHGFFINDIGRTQMLLESLRLSESEERQALATSAGDFSKYALIRHTILRMPDSRSEHRGNHRSSRGEPYLAEQPAGSFSQQGLNVPEPE